MFLYLYPVHIGYYFYGILTLCDPEMDVTAEERVPDSSQCIYAFWIRINSQFDIVMSASQSACPPVRP